MQGCIVLFQGVRMDGLNYNTIMNHGGLSTLYLGLLSNKVVCITPEKVLSENNQEKGPSTQPFILFKFVLKNGKLYLLDA